MMRRWGWGLMVLVCFIFTGTFLLIYFIAMFACGIPIFFQEVAAGQYLGSGGLTMIGQLVPMLQGLYMTPDSKKLRGLDMEFKCN